MSSNLCQYCQLIFHHWEENTKYYSLSRWRHCENIYALKASANTGCHLCSQFYRNLVSRGLADELLDSTVELLNQGLPVGPGRVMVISFDRLLSGAPSECLLLELHFRVPRIEAERETEVTAEDSDSDETVGSYDSEVGHALSPGSKQEGLTTIQDNPPNSLDISQQVRLPPNTVQALGLAKSWLDNCLGSHQSCSNSQGIIPTRLLFIDHGRVILCHAKQLESPPRYATLSHCWGQLKILKLTTKNIKAFEAGIPLGLLCKTFQDAIHITLQLGLQYLWIDSMCIIQDDSEDWRKESMSMSGVYGSSSINIAASSAPDGRTGCFFNRDPNYASLHRVKVFANEEESFFDCIEDDMHIASLVATPLANRAWALQERLLAPRTLHFSSTQIFWECNSATACETFPTRFPAELSYGDFHLHKQPVTRAFWGKIVQLYSRCSLTLSRDKLVAISGIARHIHDQCHDEYLAGLWREGLETQLCWKSRPKPLDLLPRSSDRQHAPSWSWASTEGTVNLSSFDARSQDIRLHIQIPSVDLGPHDPFGEVPSGKIYLEYQFLLQGRLNTADGLVEPRIYTKPNADSESDDSVPASINLDCRDWENYPKAILLPVMETTEPRMVRGLLLEPLSSGPFKRVGLFEMSYTAFEELKEMVVHK